MERINEIRDFSNEKFNLFLNLSFNQEDLRSYLQDPETNKSKSIDFRFIMEYKR